MPELDNMSVRCLTGRCTECVSPDCTCMCHPAPLLTGTPGMERRGDATVDLAQYADDPEYRAMIDRKAGRDPAGNGGTP